jgi:hypothetical protein
VKDADGGSTVLECTVLLLCSGQAQHPRPAHEWAGYSYEARLRGLRLFLQNYALHSPDPHLARFSDMLCLLQVRFSSNISRTDDDGRQTMGVRDRYGNDIYLTEERWQHIIEPMNHPEMADYEKELEETIRRGQRK